MLDCWKEVRMRLPALAARMLMLMLGMAIVVVPLTGTCVWGGDLKEVLKTGKLRHLGIPYANFVTEEKSGLDVELMQLFAAHLGLKYEFVETNWQDVVADLTGKVVKPQGEDVGVVGESPVRGDVIATGFTILPWRKKVVDFSMPTFPTGVWVIARADSALQPIAPTGDISRDIKAVKKALQGKSVLALRDSCLDPSLYGLNETGAEVKLFPSNRNLNEMIPTVMARMADTTLMDVPVALIALEKWPGEIKVLGPVSPLQEMACAFRKTSPKLRHAFDEFFGKCKTDGIYQTLVRKYYRSVFSYYGEFFKN
jgi:ABC-type amino acid transport substrate-binding protein